jgi:hypothetical protein
MFDALGGDLDTVGDGLAVAAKWIRAQIGDAHLRLGIADHSPELQGRDVSPWDPKPWRSVDAGIEVSVAPARVTELPEISRSLRTFIDVLAKPSSAEVMAGPVFSVVPAREGASFSSLAFRRDPGQSSGQFRNWWLQQHAPLVTPILGEHLYAYDQVHVDFDMTQRVSRALGITPVAHDAYDNLTYANVAGALMSSSDAAAMTRVWADENGRIDNSSRRAAIMRLIL